MTAHPLMPGLNLIVARIEHVRPIQSIDLPDFGSTLTPREARDRVLKLALAQRDALAPYVMQSTSVAVLDAFECAMNTIHRDKDEVYCRVHLVRSPPARIVNILEMFPYGGLASYRLSELYMRDQFEE